VCAQRSTECQSSIISMTCSSTTKTCYSTKRCSAQAASATKAARHGFAASLYRIYTSVTEQRPQTGMMRLVAVEMGTAGGQRLSESRGSVSILGDYAADAGRSAGAARCRLYAGPDVHH